MEWICAHSTKLRWYGIKIYILADFLQYNWILCRIHHLQELYLYYLQRQLNKEVKPDNKIRILYYHFTAFFFLCTRICFRNFILPHCLAQLSKINKLAFVKDMLAHFQSIENMPTNHQAEKKEQEKQPNTKTSKTYNQKYRSKILREKKNVKENTTPSITHSLEGKNCRILLMIVHWAKTKKKYSHKR